MGETIGPLNGSELRSHAASGRLAIDSNVRKGTDGQWVPASRVKGLFDKPLPPPPPPTPPPLPTSSTTGSPSDLGKTAAEPSGPVYSMTGIQDLLEVFDDRVAISPQGIMGFLNKGIKGTKEIPFTSVIAIQFKEAGALFNGYLQFTIPGGNESKGGILAATKDENTFMFSGSKSNVAAKEIKKFIDAAIRKARSPQPTASSASLTDELQKLAALRASGVLTDDEFQSAKRKLIG